MTRNRSFWRKVTYGIAIAVLLFPLFYLGQPATTESRGGKLSQMRLDNSLTQASLGDVDPASETMKLVTLGLRPVAWVVLWERANTFKKKEDWDSLSATLNQLVKLDPNVIQVWEFQAHNLSYNVSVEFDDYRHRYLWVKKGLDFLMDGTRYNKNEPKLLWTVGWYLGHKMGTSDEKLQFRRLFRTDQEFHGLMQEEGGIVVDDADAQGADGRPDSWLVSRKWYQKAEDAVAQGKYLRGKSPLIFYADAPMARINYAMSIEKEGVLDEKAQIAWEKAGDDWRRYGDRSIPHTSGHNVRLNDFAKLREERDAIRAKYDELLPNIAAKITAEKKAKLSEAEREVLDLPPEKRTPFQKAMAEHAQANIQAGIVEMLERAPADVKERAQRVAERLLEIDQIYLLHTDSYRAQVNYGYWTTRCEMEQTEDAVAAHRHLWEAQKSMEAADPDNARKSFEQAWDRWAAIFERFPEMVDELTINDLGAQIAQYNEVLGQLDQKFPEDFKLRQIWEAHQARKAPRREMDQDPTKLLEQDMKAMRESGGGVPNKPSEKPAEKPAERPAEKPAEKPAT